MKEVRNHDPTGRSYYDKVCNRMGLVPVSYLKRHITDPEITMRFHGLGPAATKAIALVLRDNITLEKLNLQGNWIEGDGGLAMARMLEDNDYITEINLSDNKLGSIGAKYCLVEENVRLKSCNISWNGFGPEGGAAIGEAMASNSALLELDDVPIEFEFLRIFEDIKSKKPNFKLIHGPILSSGNTADDLGKPAVHPYKRKEPVLILDQHIIVNDMRLLDILKKYDPQGGFTVTPEEFVKAVEDLAVPFNKPKLETACVKLAADQAGRIYFGDFIKQQQDQIKNSGGDDEENGERFEQ
ncbi:LR74A-like protein [Mya arenaria]|uniref:LR74A-like protein n=1 Tax=Mya arenaria TaxID=6604 RepID=A0ABY7FEG7_MYAAR|nr:LR74A-like protein [Mya arenaria]